MRRNKILDVIDIQVILVGFLTTQRIINRYDFTGNCIKQIDWLYTNVVRKDFMHRTTAGIDTFVPNVDNGTGKAISIGIVAD